MWEYRYTDELYHHGVKGMKWGVRKKRPASLTKAKSNYKSAQDEYVKSFNKAYGKSLAAYSPLKNTDRIMLNAGKTQRIKETL